jgi:hypothetical protein
MAHGERVETEAVAAGVQEDEAVEAAVIAVVAVTVVEVVAVAMVAVEVAVEVPASQSCRDQTPLPSTQRRQTVKERQRIRPLRKRRKSN